MKRPVSLAFWSLALGACIAPLAAAQQTIPTDLATALAASGGFGGDGEPVILVGALPPSLKVTLPAGAVLLGSATYGRNVTAVVALRGPSDSAISALTASVQASGWKAPRRVSMSFRNGGFIAPPRNTGASALTPPSTFCGDSATLLLRPVRRRGDSSWIAIRVTPFAPAPAFNECNMRMFPMEAQRAALPLLYNPAAALSDVSACFRAEFGQVEEADRQRYNSTRGNLRIKSTPDAIADHYAKQLRDSGWAPTAPAAIALPPATSTWTRRDSLGVQKLTLTVAPIPSDSLCYTLNMNVQPVRP